jgi:hypothetical protein
MNTITRIGIVSMLLMLSLVAITANAHAATYHTANTHRTANFPWPPCPSGPYTAYDGIGTISAILEGPGGPIGPYRICSITEIEGIGPSWAANVVTTVWGYDGSYHVIETGITYHVPGQTGPINVFLPQVTMQCGVIYHIETIVHYWTWWGTVLASDSVNTSSVNPC